MRSVEELTSTLGKQSGRVFASPATLELPVSPGDPPVSLCAQGPVLPWWGEEGAPCAGHSSPDRPDTSPVPGSVMGPC